MDLTAQAILERIAVALEQIVILLSSEEVSEKLSDKEAWTKLDQIVQDQAGWHSES